MQKAEPLRCLALRTRGGRLKSSVYEKDSCKQSYEYSYFQEHTLSLPLPFMSRSIQTQIYSTYQIFLYATVQCTPLALCYLAETSSTVVATVSNRFTHVHSDTFTKHGLSLHAKTIQYEHQSGNVSCFGGGGGLVERCLRTLEREQKRHSCQSLRGGEGGILLS